MEKSESLSVQIITLGGTIAYTKNGIMSGEELVTLLPKITDNVTLTVSSIIRKSSSSLEFKDIFKLIEHIKQSKEDGIDAVIVTLGTDTIEEVAFMLSLYFKDLPIVVTGAMNHSETLNYDGMKNLFDAIKICNSQIISEVGTVVVMNGMIHAAEFVRKFDTQNIHAFTSNPGPMGRIVEDKLTLFYNMKPKIHIGNIKNCNQSRVLLYTTFFSDDGELLENIIDNGYKGLVIEGLGGGHVPEKLAFVLESIAEKIPVILSTKLESGKVLENTYFGYAGSETELLKKGLISAGWLSSNKARILLYLLIIENKTMKEIKKIFKLYS